MPQPDWEELERRIARIERHIGLNSAQTAPAAPAVPAAPHPAVAVVNATGLLPKFGQALVGLAGAYLLRALTESATIPPRAGVGLGILYAVLWLVWAAWTPAVNRLETALHSLTSVLVLCPLLWEATLHFHAISTWTASVVLTCFAVLALAVSWRRNQLLVSTIVALAALATAAGLLIATRDVAPFTVFFLAIAAATEVSACLDHWLGERWLVALAADLAVLLATWLLTREGGLPDGYNPITFAWLLGAQASLLAIYLTSTIVRTLLRAHNFTSPETGQCAAAFLIAVGGGLRLSNENHAVAVFALVCAAACYLVSFAVLDRGSARGRNFYTYSTFGILLALAGSRILFAGVTASATWSGLALACIWAGSYFGRLTLQIHGGLYLLLAIAGTGGFQRSADLVLGGAHWDGGAPFALWGGLLAATLCYLLTVRDRPGDQSASAQVLRVTVAATFVWLLAGACVGAILAGYHAAAGTGGHPYCATLRTGVLAGLALLLAWAGSRWGRVELSRLIYPTMLLGAYRLVTIDLSQEHKTALFLSLLLFGGTLTALPRLARKPSAEPA